MANAEVKIGLLSTAEDPVLVHDTLTSLHLMPESTEVVVISTAGNLSGKKSDADMTIEAFSEFKHITVFDVAQQRNGAVTGRLNAALSDGISDRLLVVTGGETDFLQKYLQKSGADRVITQGVRTGALALVTFNAGTTLMGTHLEVTRADHMAHPDGLGIVHASLVCHFNRGNREEETLRRLADDKTRRLGANTIIGIHDNQAVISTGRTKYSVTGHGLASLFERNSIMDVHTRRFTRQFELGRRY